MSQVGRVREDQCDAAVRAEEVSVFVCLRSRGSQACETGAIGCHAK